MMTHVNFNRLVNHFLVLLVLLVTGCSEAPKENLSSADDAPVANDEGLYPPHSGGNKLKLNNHHNNTKDQYETVWERLFSLYALPEIQHPRIDRAIDWYLQHPASLAIIQQRAEPYLYLILDEIEAKGMPGELALLPVVESAFVPDAYSKADASGLWQFVPGTGEDYGLEQNEWYDGRRDIYASTQAATTYLKELSEMFDGDWLLALASYNCGQNKVKRTIEKIDEPYKDPDYWTLDLPEETQDYVPKLLAISRIFAHAEEYGIDLRYIPNKPYVEMVDIQSPMDLKKAAQLAHTPLEKFKKLNPGFNRSCTAPQGPHRLLVPADKAELFKTNLASLPFDERLDINQFFYEQRMAAAKQEQAQAQEKLREQEQLARLNREQEKIKQAEAARNRSAISANPKYTVKRGDSLNTIASKTHTSIKELQALNKLPTATVRSGMTLLLPATPSKSNSPAPLAAKKSAIPLMVAGNPIAASKKTNPKQSHATEVTAPAAVAATRNPVPLVTHPALKTTSKTVANGKTTPEHNSKTINKVLAVANHKLPGKANTPQLASSTATIKLLRYTVGKGDSLTHIAKKFNVPLSELHKSNADLLAKGLRPGQTLKILVDGQPRS